MTFDFDESVGIENNEICLIFPVYIPGLLYEKFADFIANKRRSVTLSTNYILTTIYEL